MSELADITPSKKRKRLSENNSSKVSELLTSTPKNKSYDNPSFNFKFPSQNKENNFWFSDSCMEVKSISELVLEKGGKVTKNNDYEIIRKPPKKKTKTDIEESCFTNPGLDLNAAEKVLNPFEVVREENSIASKLEDASHCFINPCLNLNLRDSESNNQFNPFEVKREITEESKAEKVGIENPALDLQSYALVLPVTPNINQRIDFEKLSHDGLTPCSMMTNKLVLDEGAIVPTTPKRSSAVKQRKSLSTISEELDIGEELDCYQLELENSMNEAKAKNQKYKFDITKTFKPIDEEIDIDKVPTPIPVQKEINNETYTKEKSENAEVVEIVEPTAEATVKISKEEFEVINISNENPDVQYEEVENDSFDFQKPAPFQRNYRKNDKTDSNDAFKQPTSAAPNKSNLGSVIRRSIRKLMHHDKTEKSTKPEDAEKEHEGLISSIRHSFRRKPKTMPPAQNLEISIISEDSRTVYTENKVEIKSQSEIKSTFARTGFRRSTKEVKKQVMKSVFQKKVEEFDLY